MVTTNKAIRKETASVKHYKQKKNNRIYITKRINLDAKSNFADNERVIVINEDDFSKHYDNNITLDDYRPTPAETGSNENDFQDKYNELLIKYEDALKQINQLEKEKSILNENHFEELQDKQSQYNLLNAKYVESQAELEKASAINDANYDAYITALENISIKSEIALKSAISDAVKQTTIHNNNEYSKLSLIKRIRKQELPAPAIADDTEIFAPAFDKIKSEINSYKFLQI